MQETEIGVEERDALGGGEREGDRGRKAEDWRRKEKALSFTCQSVLAGMSQSSLLLEA